jgi:hypothetical protein
VGVREGRGEGESLEGLGTTENYPLGEFRRKDERKGGTLTEGRGRNQKRGNHRLQDRLRGRIGRGRRGGGVGEEEGKGTKFTLGKEFMKKTKKRGKNHCSTYLIELP